MCEANNDLMRSNYQVAYIITRQIAIQFHWTSSPLVQLMRYKVMLRFNIHRFEHILFFSVHSHHWVTFQCLVLRETKSIGEATKDMYTFARHNGKKKFRRVLSYTTIVMNVTVRTDTCSSFGDDRASSFHCVL